MQTNDAAQFWRDYEAKIGEKILKYSLGCYFGGWKEYETSLWGLVIVTEAGFRFHHFPHEGWITALARLGGGGGTSPTEKTIFIPKEAFVSYAVDRPKSWILRLLTPSAPKLLLRYRPDAAGALGAEPGSEAMLIVELDREYKELEAALAGLMPKA